MAPILIDSRGLFKLGSVTLLLIATVFAGGFFTGYQKASGFYQLKSPAQVLTLPEKATAQISAIEAQVPEVIAAGETIDVDQAEIDTGIVEPSITTPQAANHSAENSSLEVELEMELAHAAAEQLETGLSVPPVEDKHPEPDFSQSNAAKAKFTVQVGTFGQLLNAEKMMKKLQADDLDAYITNYTAKNNKTRYNVRFGYFSDKKTASKLLRQYKTSQQGDGYLVKFSASNIVTVAEARDANSNRDASSNKSGDGKQAAPSVQLPTDTVENISQLNIPGVSVDADVGTVAASSVTGSGPGLN